MEIDGTLCRIGAVTDNLAARVEYYSKVFAVSQWKWRRSEFTGPRAEPGRPHIQQLRLRSLGTEAHRAHPAAGG
jgi:hypothetical protein